MKRIYTITVTAEVSMQPEKAHGSAARTELGEHVQTLAFLGEEGGKIGMFGDADHLGQMITQVDDVAKNVARAAVAKAHEHLTTNFKDTVVPEAVPAGLEVVQPTGNPALAAVIASAAEEAAQEAAGAEDTDKIT